MQSNLNRVSLPYRGGISSAELNAYFNSIIEEINDKTQRIEKLEDFLSNHFVYGMYLENHTQFINVSPGGYFKDGQEYPIQAPTVYVNTPVVHNDYFVIQNENNNFAVVKEYLDQDIVIARLVNGKFDYSVRKKISDAIRYTGDKRRVITLQNKRDLDNNSLPERIAYTMDERMLHIYAGIADGWKSAERVVQIFDEKDNMSSENPGTLGSIKFLIPSDLRFRFRDIIVVFEGFARSGGSVEVKTTIDDYAKNSVLSSLSNKMYEVKFEEINITPGVHSLVLTTSGDTIITHVSMYGVM